MDSRRARELVTAERTRIEAALQRLSGEVRVEGMLARQQTGESDSGSELATEMVEVALVANVRTELEAVARAEERITSGSFGRSIDSRRAIPDERLEAEPLAERTLSEQRRHDAGARGPPGRRSGSRSRETLHGGPSTRATASSLSPSDSAEGPPVVRTIGHGTRTTDELASLLAAAGVTTLIDVRRYPSGKRQPHLSRERLAADLAERGLAYEWWGEGLGGRRAATAPTGLDSGWRSPAFAAYSSYMSKPAFRGALAELEARAMAGEALAIMCAETVWWRCHRRLIADALTLDGFVVEHLIDRVPGRRHQLLGPSQAPALGSTSGAS